MLPTARQRSLLNLLEQDGFVSTRGVAAHLGVSQMTVRRDLAELEHHGLLQRVHGGARAAPGPDLPYAQRARRNPEAKRAIGRCAAATVRPGETVYLDAGTTVMEVALSLRRSPPEGLKVVTHAVNVAAALAGRASVGVFQIGGELYRKTFSATGPAAVAALRSLAFDRMFLAGQGFSLEGGVTNSNLAEVEVKRAALGASSWVCLVADASKWEARHVARVAPLSQLHALVTDERLPFSARDALLEWGLEVIVAPKG